MQANSYIVRNRENSGKMRMVAGMKRHLDTVRAEGGRAGIESIGHGCRCSPPFTLNSNASW